MFPRENSYHPLLLQPLACLVEVRVPAVVGALQVEESRDVFEHELGDKVRESPGVIVEFLSQFNNGPVLGVPRKRRLK